ncbi:MAG: hypothetical protein ACKPKO_64315, partial [Candidatus Fonsibacter sp.]
MAKVVDCDCDSLGIARHLLGVGSWNDDWCVPLYWVECSDTGKPAVLTYDCRRLYDSDCSKILTTSAWLRLFEECIRHLR